MRVLVCGGRDYGEIPDDCPVDMIPTYRARAISDVRILRDTLDEVRIDNAGKGFVLIHGACKNGADRHAAYWSGMNMVHADAFPADWKTHNRAAGPIRNQRMIDEGRPDLVIAFPGGRGTADMVKRARAAGIEVREIPKPEAM